VAAAGVAARALPPLPLDELLALVAEASVYVGNDGGVLHCAVGLGVPCVAVFGPTEPDIWFPHATLGPQRVVLQEVPCRPCHLHTCAHLTCLRTLPASTVQEAVREVLKLAAAAESARA
jgi:ADP-heptose:LPS heptosyltransferase